eukprot:SAG11_NODE_384_length_9897_cov_11.158502_2_plen_192_part_00
MMTRATLLLISLGGALRIHGHEGAAQSEVLGNELSDRTHPDSASQIAFVDTSLRFERDGVLLSWGLFTGSSGRIRLQVYRPGAGGATSGEFSLVCEHVVKARTADVSLHYKVAEDERCYFQRGDVIGWCARVVAARHSPRQSRPRAFPNARVHMDQIEERRAVAPIECQASLISSQVSPQHRRHRLRQWWQ